MITQELKLTPTGVELHIKKDHFTPHIFDDPDTAILNYLKSMRYGVPFVAINVYNALKHLEDINVDCEIARMAYNIWRHGDFPQNEADDSVHVVDDGDTVRNYVYVCDRGKWFFSHCYGINYE